MNLDAYFLKNKVFTVLGYEFSLYPTLRHSNTGRRFGDDLIRMFDNYIEEANGQNKQDLADKLAFLQEKISNFHGVCMQYKSILFNATKDKSGLTRIIELRNEIINAVSEDSDKDQLKKLTGFILWYFDIDLNKELDIEM